MIEDEDGQGTNLLLAAAAGLYAGTLLTLAAVVGVGVAIKTAARSRHGRQ